MTTIDMKTINFSGSMLKPTKNRIIPVQHGMIYQ